MAQIEIYTGLPGSGKSLAAVERILAVFTRGGIVATNIKLNILFVRRYLRNKGFLFNNAQYIYLNSEHQLKFPHRYLPKGTSNCENLLVMDELATLCPARQWTKTESEFQQYLIYIRRQHHNCILITQRMYLIDKQFRGLAQFRTNFNNLSRAINVAFLGRFPWEIIIQAVYDQSDERIRLAFYLPNPKIYKCYDSLQEHVQFCQQTKIIVQKRVKTYVKMVSMFRLNRLRFKRLWRKNFQSSAP